MGSNVEETTFSEQDYTLFSKIINQQLHELKTVMQQPGFGSDPLQFGAELEMYLVDENFQAANKNESVLQLLNDKAFQVEINQYNLELNLPPLTFASKPFSGMADSLLFFFRRVFSRFFRLF